MSRTALIYDEVFLKHDTGNHPENAGRVRHAYAALRDSPFFPDLELLSPPPADPEALGLVHSQEYLDAIRRLPPDRVTFLDPDTVFGPGSLEAATVAAGAAVAAVDGIASGGFSRAFCLVRPPGHHALRGRSMGFCIFNNVAIGAAYASRKCGFGPVAIIDFDVHHGNGTQEIFFEDGEVLYCSIHRLPFYPGTGSAGEIGIGSGRGKTLNVPLPAGSGEADYMAALGDVVMPAIESHRPFMLFLSAGFDAHRADPIGGMDLGADSYGRITATVIKTAEEYCDGRVVSVLEGGYNLEALAESIQAHIEAMI
jgi:acetoin utilization deacetylase AcuC-like enzyme